MTKNDFILMEELFLFLSRTYHFGGNREMARHLDEQAISKSGGKAVKFCFS